MNGKLIPPLLCTLVVLIASLAPLSISRAQNNLLSRLDERVTEAMARWHVPGVSLAVVAGDSISETRSWGLSQSNGNTRVDSATVFALGSVTKSITAVALSVLVQEGKLDWDDRLSEHLPEVIIADSARSADVRIEDLVTHRTGVARTLLLFYGRSLSHDEVIERLQHVEPEGPVRDRFRYQNVVYSLAADVISAVSGKSYEAFLQDRLFDPLRMTRTGNGVPSPPDLDNVADAHIGRAFEPADAVNWRSLDNVAAAGGLYTTAADMLKWLQFLLHTDATSGPALPQDPGESPMTPRVLVPPSDPTNILVQPVAEDVGLLAYGRGWFVNRYRGHKMVWHAGDIDGMSAILALLPDQKAGIAILSNRQLPQLLPLTVVFGFFSDLLGSPDQNVFNGYVQLTRALAAAREDARVPSSPEFTLPIDTVQLAGAYSNPVYGTLRIEQRDDLIHFSLDEGLTGRLRAGPEDLIVFDWDDPVLKSGLPLVGTITDDVDGELRLRLRGIGVFTRNQD